MVKWQTQQTWVVNLSAFGGIQRVECFKFGEPFNMEIPSQASKEEGVETRRSTTRTVEGIVQSTNLHM